MTVRSSSSVIFTGLSGLALLLLWVLMGLNGTLLALLKTSWSGVFPDGAPLKTGFTGIGLIDFLLSILAAFFYGLQNLVETAPYLMLLDLVAALLVINMMVLIESRRPTASKWLRSSLLWQYLWNCAGVALFLPIYSLFHVEQKRQAPLTSRLPASEAQALPFTAFWSLLLPIPLLAPALFHATPFHIQDGLVIYFLTPALLVLFQVLASKAISRNVFPAYKGVARPIKTTYWIVGATSAITHLGIICYVLFSSPPNLTLRSLYFPDHRIVHQGEANILTAGALLFFQWDFLIINAVVLIHGIDLFQQAFSERQSYDQSLNRSVLTLIIMNTIIGPGAGLAFVLWCEENRQDNVSSDRDKRARAT